MRNQRPYHCPRCGDTPQGLEGVERCTRCQIDLLDGNDRPLLGSFVRQYRMRSGANWAIAILFWLFMIGAVVGIVAAGKADDAGGVGIILLCIGSGVGISLWQLLPGHLGMRRYATRVAAIDHLIRQAGPTCAIADAEGMVRIRGRVRVLEAVKDSEGTGAALIRARINVSLGGVKHSAFADRGMSGTFLVEDDTGVALVDDDAFEIWTQEGLPVDQSFLVAIREGDEVEICGPTRRGPLPTTEDAPKARGYRQDADGGLLFDGTERQRLIILADGLASTEAPDSVQVS